MTNSNLLPVSDALSLIMEKFDSTEIESVRLEHAAGRVLAESLKSTLDLPPFNNSSMDGFAVIAENIIGASGDNPVTLKVVGDIPAGAVPTKGIGPGQTMRIMTGAPLPDGANGVVPVEDTDIDYRSSGGALPDRIKVNRQLDPGDYVRVKGEDLRIGQEVLEKGNRLRPQEMGMLAMLGYSSINSYKKPRVAIISTGDELIPVEQALSPGKIRESNSHTLAAQISGCGAEVIRMGIVPDRLDVLNHRLDEIVDLNVDLIISTAGVSVGAFDFVRLAIEAYGKLDFWRVNMRPGKPLTFGNYKSIPFVGLPGNPVSAFVGFEVFLRPSLNKLAGVSHWSRREFEASLSSATTTDGRESYLRGIVREVDGSYHVEPAAHQGSGNLFSLVRANALYILPAGVKEIPAGSNVKFWFI